MGSFRGFAAIVPVGPSAEEERGLCELVDSLLAYEAKNLSDLVIVDDNISFSLQPVERVLPSHCRLRVLKNPRNGAGHGWSDGLSTGVLAAVKELLTATHLSFVVRLDTDALAIGPFYTAIQNAFARSPGRGLLGTFRLYPTGGARIKTEAIGLIERQLRAKRLLRFLARRFLERPSFVELRRAVRRNQFIKKAMLNGYVPGDHVQGGGYAISAEMLVRLHGVSLVSDPTTFLHTRIGEDIVMTMYCYACGMTAGDFNQEGEIFAVQNNGLPEAPDILLKKHYGIIHSLKSHGNLVESESREFFRHARTGKC